MATLDFSGALQSMINDRSSDSKTNRRMVKTLYGDEVIKLVKQLVVDYHTAIRETSKDVKDGIMTPEQAHIIVNHYKVVMDEGQQFVKDFFED